MKIEGTVEATDQGPATFVRYAKEGYFWGGEIHQHCCRTAYIIGLGCADTLEES